MAYKVIILYRLYMPSYFLGTFTEYPYSKTEGPVINFLLILFNKRNDIQINNRCRNRHQSAVKAI